MILEVFSAGPFDTNGILLGCSATKRAVIIDAPMESSHLFTHAVKKHSLTVEKILLTHSHWDHIAEASLLKKKFEAKVLIHEEDAGNLERPGSDGLPGIISIPGVKPDGYLCDGETVKVGDLLVKVIHTPGHTPGGVCFYLEKEKLLLSGDTLFKRGIGNLSFPTARPSLMKKSLERLAKLPADTRVIPGHGEETTIGEERIYTSWLKNWNFSKDGAQDLDQA